VMTGLKSKCFHVFDESFLVAIGKIGAEGMAAIFDKVRGVIERQKKRIQMATASEATEHTSKRIVLAEVLRRNNVHICHEQYWRPLSNAYRSTLLIIELAGYGGLLD
jgi:hypothetical protein